VPSVKNDLATRHAVLSETSSIPFNKPGLQGAELDYIAEAVSNRHLSGDGPFTKRCQELLKEELGAACVLLTHSATAALEMAALLIDAGPGYELIMPSFTFVSTANAFVLRGAVPVFADIRPDTLNFDETLLPDLITENTKAIVPVHYAGVACDMESLGDLAASHGLYVIEDAAHALGGSYKDRPLGSWGELGCFSFHATKNIQSGEGGALSINDQRFTARAEILWEKGADIAQFHRGKVGSYSWQDLGSSFLPSELVAAFLFGQLEHLTRITDRRRALWENYHELLAQLEYDGLVQRPKVPPECRPNGHIYWLALPDGTDRSRVLQALHKAGVHATSHYLPLHQSPAGRRFGKAPLPLPITEDIAGRLIRLPLHTGLTADDQERVVDALRQSIVTALP